MPFKIKNWKLFALALIFICLFAGLGMWQVWRAQQKTILLQSFAERTQHEPFVAKNLSAIRDWRFYRVKLVGRFDNEHSFLLDNKIFRGKIGYEVFTPFYAEGMDAPILVDRGFIPIGVSRDQLPALAAVVGKSTVIGMLNLPPTYVAFGTINDKAQIQWPLRVEYINLADITKLLGATLYPYILTLDPKSPYAYSIEWQIVMMGPERHMGYAVQWFALSLTLLILFVVLNRR